MTLAPVFLGSLGRRRMATLFSLVAIILGVALGMAVQAIHEAALNEFGRGVRVLAGEADLRVIGPASGFDETLFEQILQHPEIAHASPVVEVEAKLAGYEQTLRVLGIDAHPGMLAMATAHHDGLPNLGFRLGHADRPLGAEAAVCLLSSVLHELAAQGGLPAVATALRAAAASLRRGGRLIVRDFVRPADAATAVVLRHARHDLQRGRSFADFGDWYM